MPQINVFNGGLRTARAEHLIKPNESTVFLNVDHLKGILSPLADKISSVLGASKYGHFFTTSSTWFWSATPKDYVEYQERLYIGNRTGASTKILSGVEYTMGIPAPTVKPTGVASLEVPTQDQVTRMELLAGYNAAHDIPADVTLRYRAVNINAAGDYYPSETIFTLRVTSAYTPADVEYHQNNIAITLEDTNIDATVAVFRFFDNYWRKVYEGVGGVTVYDTAYDISANAEIEPYEDVGGLDGVYQYALSFYNTADDTESVPIISDEITVSNGTITVSNLEVSTNPQVDKKRLYRVGGTSTTFSLVLILDNATTSYVDTLKDDEIEGSLMDSEINYQLPENSKYLMESYAMLFAADGDKLRFTPIGRPDYWPQTYYLDFPRTITGLAKTPIGILVFNQYETWLVTGTGPLSLAQQLLTGSQGCINGDSVVNIEGSAYWASTDGICMSNGGMVAVVTDERLGKLDLSGSVNAVVYDETYYLLLDEQDEALVLDLKRQVIKKIDYNIDSFNTANDTLYGYYDGALYELEAGIFDLTMAYTSPKYIGQGLTVPKTYKNIYVYSEGEVTIEIYIDDILVQTANLTAKDTHQIKIPNNSTRGFGIQFAVTGRGIVYEIQWEEGNASQ